MFDVSHASHFGARTESLHDAGPAYRRGRPPTSEHWLSAALDEIDYGMLLVTDEGLAIHVNRAARAELDATHPLQLLGHALRARCPLDVLPLADALHAAARRGLRKLLTLGAGAQRVSVSVVPLALPADASGSVTLVMMGKRQVCEALSAQGFARSHALTAAEARVLEGLCRGVPPNQIAAQLGVAISTVRTQICSIRVKTGAQSIRALVQQVAMLPPLLGALRGAGGSMSAHHHLDARCDA